MCHAAFLTSLNDMKVTSGKNRGLERAVDVMTQAEEHRRGDGAEAEALLRRARALQSSITSGFWELGKVLAELSERKSHLALGYDRFDAMVDERLGISKSVAMRLMAVAARLPRKEAVKLGQERAYALIVYASSTPAGEDPVALAKADAPIVGGRPLSQTSVRDLMAARHKRPKPLKQRAIEAEDRRLATAVKAQATRAGLRGVKVEVVSGEVVVRMTRRAAEKWVVPG